MKTLPTRASLAAFVLWAPLVGAETPLAKPLADFDKLVSQLKTSSVVGEPIRVGDTAVIPFAAIKFGLGGAGGTVAFGGGMDAKTVPLGILIVEGDEIRAELLPEQDVGPTLVHQMMQAILDRKVVIMGNGVNLGNAPGRVQDLAPLISGMMGQTTVMGNALNLGGLSSPAPSLDELEKLLAAKKYAEAVALADGLLAKDLQRALADFEAALAKKPSAEGYFYLGEAWRRQGQSDKAAAAYRKALELRPDYEEAAKALAGRK
jgi:uncharacterized spore protein YtfJ